VKRAVVASTWPGGKEPLGRLLKSLEGCQWPVVIVVNNCDKEDDDWTATLPGMVFVNREPGYELGTIKTIMERTDYDEFLLLQDTFEIKDQSFIDEVMESEDSVALGPTFFHYAGKWKRSVLEQMEIPIVRNKRESIHWEHTFSRLYWERDRVWVFDPHFHDGEHKGFVDEFGRQNMVLENDYYIKRKGDWGQRPL
jgi:hypothetical protein